MSDIQNLITGVIVAAIMGLCAISGSCDLDPGAARRMLGQEGVSDIRLDGFDPFACSRGELTNQKFSGVKNGSRVSGYVCGDGSGAMTVHYK